MQLKRHYDQMEQAQASRKRKVGRHPAILVNNDMMNSITIERKGAWGTVRVLLMLSQGDAMKVESLGG